jgi:hypothetical protein
MTVYVIGLQEYGGAHISREEYYTNEKMAYAARDKMAEESTQGGKYKPIAYKVFHLYLASEERISKIRK